MTTHRRTMYCGRPHRLFDGAPLEHACRILDPEFLEAEQGGDLFRASELLMRMPLVLHAGVAAVEASRVCRPRTTLDGDLGDPRGELAWLPGREEDLAGN